MSQLLNARQRAKAMLQQVKGSAPVTAIKRAPQYCAWKLAPLQAGDSFTVDLSLRVGMGALMAYALRVAHWAAENRMALKVRASSPLYGERQDIFPLYFLSRFESDGRAIGTQRREWLLTREIASHIPHEAAKDLFATHFTPNQRLAAEIDAASGGRDFDLSIHFRGTDKFMETGLTDAQLMLTALKPHMPSARNVFLATDDANFSVLVRQAWPEVTFTSYDRGVVMPGKARHFSAMSPEDKALEALVNMYALARAPHCVRTMSYMSSFVGLIRPSVGTTTINGKIDENTPFPERDLLLRERAAGGEGG